MRRRELIAGAGGVGILGVGGLAAAGIIPFEDEPDRIQEPVELAGIDARGSDGSPQLVPAPDRPTFVDIFATTCSVCERGMPELRKAHDRLGDTVAFRSVTAETRSFVDDEDVAAWWADHDGNWQVVRDEHREFVIHYSLATPTGLLFDATGALRWQKTGAKTAEEIATQVESVVE